MFKDSIAKIYTAQVDSGCLKTVAKLTADLLQLTNVTFPELSPLS